jgi:hypothetical protein
VRPGNYRTELEKNGPSVLGLLSQVTGKCGASLEVKYFFPQVLRVLREDSFQLSALLEDIFS